MYTVEYLTDGQSKNEMKRRILHKNNSKCVASNLGEIKIDT